MNNSDVKKLEKKILSLEEKISKLENKNKLSTDKFGFNIYTKNLLNKNIISSTKFRIKTLKTNKNNSLFFQLKVKFLNYFSQDIQFKLFAEDIQVNCETIYRENGISEEIIFGTYQNNLSDSIKIDLLVKPKSGKQITIINTTLTVWGDNQQQNDEYNATETNTHYLLSYISNNRLYYKLFQKNENFEELDFIYFAEASSHSLCTINNEIYLFYVDTDNNLLLSNINNGDEQFIEGNISKVSCCSINNSIIFCYITLDGKCFYSEMTNNNILSTSQIKISLGLFSNCYIYYDKNKEKYYLIITKTNGSNYLLESINSIKSSTENIKATTNIYITTGESNLWNFHSIID